MLFSLQFPVWSGSGFRFGFRFGGSRALNFKLLVSFPYFSFINTNTKYCTRICIGNNYLTKSKVNNTNTLSSIKMPQPMAMPVPNPENPPPEEEPSQSIAGNKVRETVSQNSLSLEPGQSADPKPGNSSMSSPATATAVTVASPSHSQLIRPGGRANKPKTIITGSGGVVTNGVPHSKGKNPNNNKSFDGKSAGNASSGARSNGGIRKSSPSTRNSSSPERLNLGNQRNGTEEDGYNPELGRPRKVYKVVLTGGPCGGKTTAQARLCTFFENLGWKVFRSPEAANILLGGGVKFSELSQDQAFHFQEQLLRTMMQIESVFFTLAETMKRDVLVICDRGAMDASAFIPREKWEAILRRNNLNEVDIRDTRYNQIIHMVSAANGAEAFYTIEDHASRSEGLELARELDQKAAQAWVGHPYLDLVDNSTDFETKVNRTIQIVCQKLGIDAGDRLQRNSRKVKFLIRSPLPADELFPAGFQDFSVIHDYLQTSEPKMQARLRKRGQKGIWSYTYTVRRPEINGQVVEIKTNLTQRDYQTKLLAQRDHNHVTVYKTRRCFLLNDQYFQLDIYKEPCHPRCKDLILLETYSTLNGTELQQRLPSFLSIVKEVTGDPRFSMFNLSLKDSWLKSSNFRESAVAGHDEDDSA